MSDETASLKGGLTFGTTAGPYDGRQEKREKRRAQEIELHGEGLLGEALGEARGDRLSERFTLPPFTVLSARDGWWQDRKRAWLSLGIQSELGRGENLQSLSEAQQRQLAEGSAYLGPDGKRATSYGGQAGLNAIMKQKKAVPGGALMPAMDYSKRERGDGKGRAIAAPSQTSSPTLAKTVPIIRAEPAPGAPKPLIIRSEPATPPVTTGVGAMAFDALVAAQPAPQAPKRLGMPTITMEASRPTPARVPAAARASSAAPLTPPASSWTAPTELPHLAGAARISIDVETCDPDLLALGPGSHRGAFVAGIAVGRDDGARWYLPMRHEGGDNLDPDLVVRWAREELGKYDGEVVGAHLIYDLELLGTDGIALDNAKRFLDIQNAEPLLDEHRFSYKLDTLARDYLGKAKDQTLLNEAARSYGWSTEDQIKSNLWRLPARYVGAYAEGDVDLPLRIIQIQESRLRQEELEQVWDVECGQIPILLAMRQRGVKVNLDRVEQVRKVLVAERDKWLAIVRDHCGPAAELMAPASLGAGFAEQGIKLVHDERGIPMVNKAVLGRYRGNPLADATAAGRRCNTLITMFIDGHILGHQVGGRLYCEFPQLKSDDGGTIARYASRNPNLQNVPSRKNEMDDEMDLGMDVVRLIRGCWVPDEGEDWIRHDLSQIEYRYLVHFAVGLGAEEARESYRTDPKTDFHKMCAVMAKVDPEDSKKRKAIKGLNFGKIFGAGINQLAALLGCSVAEAKSFNAEYDAKLPFCKATLEKATEWVHKQGFVRTVLGRKGRFPFWEPVAYGDKRKALPEEQARREYGDSIKRSRAYAGLSRKLQGSASDHIKSAMKQIWDTGICRVIGAPLLTVHDELDWQRNRSKEHLEAIEEARRLLEGAITLKVPVLAEAETGADWGATS